MTKRLVSDAGRDSPSDPNYSADKAQAEEIFHTVHDLVTGKTRDADPERLGKLAVFAGVSEFPVRVKCATLCWHTARAALEGREEPVSTE